MISLFQLRQSALAKNAGWMLIGQAALLIAQAVYFIVLARLLGSAQYGIFVGTTALVAICGNFSSIGSGMVMLRYVSTDSTRFPAYWGNAIISTLLSGSLIVCLLLLTGPYLLHSNMLGMLAMIAVGDCIFGKLTECAGQAFQAMERLRITALLNLLAGVLRLTAAAGLWMLAGKVTASVWAAASLSVSAVSVLRAVVLVSVKIGAPRFQLRLLGQRLAEGFGFSVAYSTTSIYNDVDKAMLTNAGMYAANGTYSVAYRIMDLACMPIRAVHAGALPHFFRAGTARTLDSVRFAKQILKRTLPYGLLAAIGLFALAPCVTLVVGSSYSSAVAGLRWLCLIPAFRSLHLSAGDAITSGGHQRLRTASQFGAAGLNFCLNLYLIPRWSWVGAAWASLLTDGMLAAVNWGILTILVRKQAEQ